MSNGIIIFYAFVAGMWGAILVIHLSTRYFARKERLKWEAMSRHPAFGNLGGEGRDLTYEEAKAKLDELEARMKVGGTE